MDFSLSDRMKTILEMIDEFVAKELIPLERDFLSNSYEKIMPLLEEKGGW